MNTWQRSQSDTVSQRASGSMNEGYKWHVSSKADGINLERLLTREL